MAHGTVQPPERDRQLRWSWLDSLDLSVVTLTTVGYGDLAPQIVAGRTFTVVFVLVGLGAFTAFGTALAGKRRERFRRPS